MRNSVFYITSHLPKALLTLPLAVLLSSCLSSSDDEVGLENQVPSEPSVVVRGTSGSDQALMTSVKSRTLSIQILDAASLEPIEESVSLSFYAPDAAELAYLTNDEGDAFTNGQLIITDNGTTNVLIDSGFADQLSPISFRIQASASNYFAGGSSVVVEPALEDGQQIVTLKLVSKIISPTGVTVVSNTSHVATDGVLDSELVVETESGIGISLPANTTLTDIDGNLLSGNLHVEIAYFDPTEDSALDSFPGGFSVGSDTDMTDSSDGEGFFMTAGFLAVDIIDENNQKAHQLGTTADLVFRIPDDIINPETGEPVKIGDVIPVWSHNETTGQWGMHDQEGIVTEDDQGLYLSVQTDHLSYWNLDWHYSAKCMRQVNFTDLSGNLLTADQIPASGIIIKTEIEKNGARQRTSTGTLLDPENLINNTPNAEGFSFSITPSYGDIDGDTVIVSGSQETELVGYYTQCKEPMLVAIDVLAIPEPVSIKASAYITAPTDLTYWDVNELILKAYDKPRASALNEAQAEKRIQILNITHPNSNPENSSTWGGSYQVYTARSQPLVLSTTYQKFLDEDLFDRTEIATIQQILKTQYVLDGETFYYTYRTNTGHYSYGTATMINGEVEFSLPVDSAGTLYANIYGYINDPEDGPFNISSYLQQSITAEDITNGRIELAFENAVAIARIYQAIFNNNSVEQ